MSLYEDAQSVISHVWQYFVVEKNLAGYDHYRGCIYLGKDGRRCALGCCIPASDEFKEMHHYVGSARGLKEDWPDLWDDVFNDVDLAFMSSLQLVHDGCANANPSPSPDGGVDRSHETFLTTIEEQLRGLAVVYNLSVPLPK